jgi:SRSO17 transposase
MLPEIRNEDHLFPVPKFNVDDGDVKNFINELKGFHEVFIDCFHRSESRDHFFRYMVGQFSELERKSIEPIALAVEDGNVRAMQRFISDAEWDDGQILNKYRNIVNEDLGSSDGVIIFDETGFVKKGNDSVGVAKQYCGTIGKVENCQVGVFAAYASPSGYALLDKRLFVPKKWFTDEYQLRREKCGLPTSTTFRTKPQLATEMLNHLVEEAAVPFKYIVADSLYGNSPEFIEAVESHAHLTYFVEIPCDTRCWIKRPVTREKRYKYRGKIRSKTIVEKTEKKPIDVSTLAKSINDFFWYRRKKARGALK